MFEELGQIKMKKENMLTVLEEELDKNLSSYGFAIDWDKSNHVIEVIVQLVASNQLHEKVTDTDGNLSNEEAIEFEDSLLFYHPEKSVFDSEDYLAVFPYEGKKGISRGFLQGFSHYLLEVLEEGQSDLMDFLTDETLETFELKWNKTAFEQVLAKQPDRVLTDYIPYPSY